MSEGGIQTSIAVPTYKLMFDIGRGSPRTVEIPNLFLTHGHLDHSSGVPFYISQRSLRKLPAANIYCPPEMADPLKQILQLWCQIEGYQTEYHIHALDYSKFYPLKGNSWIQAIPSKHRVQSNGYTILQKAQKLKSEFKHLEGHQIALMKQERDDLFFEELKPQISFSGDTQIEWVLDNEIVKNSKVLFLECTYICDKRPVERARKWGHIHLNEIVNYAEAFRNVEKLFLIHFSPRYSHREIKATLKRELPDWLYKKTTPFI